MSRASVSEIGLGSGVHDANAGPASRNVQGEGDSGGERSGRAGDRQARPTDLRCARWCRARSPISGDDPLEQFSRGFLRDSLRAPGRRQSGLSGTRTSSWVMRSLRVVKGRPVQGRLWVR